MTVLLFSIAPTVLHLFVCLSAQHWLRFSESQRHDATSPPANFSSSSVRRKAVSDSIMSHF